MASGEGALALGGLSPPQLLTDGTVLIHASCSGNWYKLTPDVHGSYINGTWTNLAPMHDTRYAFATAVLRDGRIFVAGGEYGSGTATAEVYDPLRNIWQSTPPAGVMFADAESVLLPDGKVLVAPAWSGTTNVIFDPATGNWLSGGNNLARQDEASWVKLPDDSILAIEASGAERPC